MLKVQSFLKQNWVFYLLGFILLFGIKYQCSNASSEDLEWILAPTAWWVKIISGIGFEKETHIGYVNHSFRFILATSCSGVQFMLITFATLLYSFVHRMGTMAKRIYWTIFSIGLSFLATIFVNGFRIVLSIYLPIYLEVYLPTYFQQTAVYSQLLSPERLHTLIGTSVYFVCLCLIYKIVNYITKIFAGSGITNKGFRSGFKLIPVLFWYLLIGLGIPLLNRAYNNNAEGFLAYAQIVFFVCLVSTVSFYLTSVTFSFAKPPHKKI